MKKKIGCKKGEIKIAGHCFPKNMKQSENIVLDWDLEYGFRGNKLIIKNLSGCVVDNAHIRAKCSAGAVHGKKEMMAKNINNWLKKYTRVTEDFKIPDKQWKNEYAAEGKERIDYIETIKIGNSKYDPEAFFGLLNEALDQPIITKSKQFSKKLVGEKIKITYWQEKKNPDGPVVLEGSTGFYVLAPRIKT